MEIATKTGDKGESGLFNGQRLPKSHEIFTALGDLDELNSHLGLCALGAPDFEVFLRKVQDQIYRVMGVVGFLGQAPKSMLTIEEMDVAFLEEEVDRLEKRVGDLSKFLRPGTSEGAARLHVARCVCRRAERALVACGDVADLPAEILRYVNRLSDVLFLMACSEEREIVEQG